MMIINMSKGKQSYSQRNNVIKPLESCNVTAMVMALDYLDYRFPQGAYEQPEDNLRKFITDQGKNPENHYELSEYTNRWMGKEVTRFSMAKKVNEILGELLSSRPVVISGTFPGFPTKKPKPLGHIVCLVGAIWNMKDWIGPPDTILWDDPYGNTLDDWKGSGNDVCLTYQQFVDWIKPVGNASVKWAHCFTR